MGVFDRKLHLAGAEWGAWLIDNNAEFHGGVKTPSPRPRAPAVGEVVKYTDTDNNGFLDTVEYDYDGNRKIDLRVSLLDYRSSEQPHPDVSTLIDTHREGWKGLNAVFNRLANQSWHEALIVYRAAWRRGLTTPETDKLAFASSVGERYDHGYWLKEKIFRQLRARLQEVGVSVGVIQSEMTAAAAAADVRRRRHLRDQLRVRVRLPARQHGRARSRSASSASTSSGSSTRSTTS